MTRSAWPYALKVMAFLATGWAMVVAGVVLAMVGV